MSRTLLGIFIAIVTTGSVFAASETAFTKVADAFDFPVGNADGDGYYKARGYRPNGHLGEDWNGRLGGDTDLGDPVYAIGNGVVVLARNMRMGWGNVVIIRHAYYEGRSIRYIDSLYGHLHQINVREGQKITRRQNIGTIGNNRGMYNAHLHFEIRKNLSIGMKRASFARDSSNYHDPTKFIEARRSVSGGPSRTQVAMNTFTDPGTYNAPRSGSAPAAPKRRRNVKMSITATYQDVKVRQYE